jgi:hypothetical protein
MTVAMHSLPLFGGLLAILVGCGIGESGGSQAVHNPDTPGWTGRTLVMGSHSTVAGDAAATEQQQKWPFNPSR